MTNTRSTSDSLQRTDVSHHATQPRTRDVVVVTGMGGMGVAIARRLGAGRQLVLADRDADRLALVEAQLRGEGMEATAVTVDVGDPDSVAALATVAADLGTMLHLIHTAGVSPIQASAAQVMRVDLVGTALLLDAFTPLVQRGTVAVCIASMAGHLSSPLTHEQELALATAPPGELSALDFVRAVDNPSHAYSLAKRANHLRVQTTSLRWGPRGGRCVSLSPGIIATPMGLAEMAGPGGVVMQHMIDISPARRIGTAEDIAAVVELLVHPAAGFITGSDVLVDGGTVAALRWHDAIES